MRDHPVRDISKTKRTFDLESLVKRLECTRAAVFVISVVIAVGIFSCAEKHSGDSEQVEGMSRKTIEQVQKEHTDRWMAIPGVEGTAIGLSEGQPCITIFTSIKADELRAKIPSSVDGYPIVIKETGTFHALDQQ